jgi:hypothetical protein
MASAPRHIHRSLLILFFLLTFNSLNVFAQATKVKGRVVDASSGEGIPFAGVYFNNSTTGVSTDMDGYFLLETRNPSLNVLTASILGYVPQELPVDPGQFNELHFRLVPALNELDAVIVKPDDSYVRWILSQVDSAKRFNDPERRERYNCDVYSKMELDLSNADTKLIREMVPRNFDFVYDYLDTSVVSGQPYLPVMITESTSKYYYQRDPKERREVILASRISGIENEATLAQFTGNMLVKINFYDNFLQLFEINIPSPISASGTTYYNYYLIDSLKIDGRKTYKIRFHPSKWVSSPTFDGEMSIDAKDFALRDIHAKLKKGNVNWIRALMIDVEHQPLADSSWFYKQDKLYVDFSVTMRDSSKMIAFLGNRQIDYSNPRFDSLSVEESPRSADFIQLGKNVLKNDEEYWQSVRPYPLSAREQGIYNMVDSIKNVPLYHDIASVVNTLATGFYDFKYIGIGPYSSLYSFNPLEGNRVQLGIRTTKDLSKKVRVMLYGAYGFKDRAWKGGGTVEYMFDNQPTRKLVALYKHDIMQIGRGGEAFGSGDIMSSVLAKAGGLKLSPVNDYSLSYQHEWSSGFNTSIALESRRIFSNHFVPMYSPDSARFNSVGYNQAHLQARFSWQEAVTRGVFDKYYVYTRYPILTFDLMGSLKVIAKNDYSFLRTEGSLQYYLRLPPAGTSRIIVNGGNIFGTVPYPMLHIFPGNGTYALDRNAFACMSFYEFVADHWLSVFWEHHFKGFFLGKIPVVKKLQWREIFTMKMAYGSLRRENNGILGDPDFGSGMLFPQGMSTLNRPYIEMGVGISNIFRILRIDMFWRMTHRHQFINGVKEPHDNLVVLNFGFDFRF